MCKCQKIFIKNQDIYLLKGYISVSSKPSKYTLENTYIKMFKDSSSKDYQKKGRATKSVS